MASLLIKLGIFGALISGCAAGPIYAKRDYDQYPDYRKEIALHNIKHILSDICDSSSADEEGFNCQKKECVSSHFASNVVGASTVYYNVCDTYEDKKISARWAELGPGQISLLEKSAQLQIKEEKLDMKDARQASELQEAMREYLK